MTYEQIKDRFNARKPTSEEMNILVDEIAKWIEDSVDQGFIDEMMKVGPTIPLREQKRMALLNDAIHISEAKGQDATNLREDLAYLENKYRGQPREE